MKIVSLEDQQVIGYSTGLEDYVPIATSALGALPLRKLNEALEGIENLEKVNRVLANAELEDLSDSSIRSIKVATEAISEKLLGRKKEYSCESFKNRSQLTYAIEENKGIIATIWDAIIGFIKGIYNFLFGWIGKSSSANASTSKDISTLARVSAQKPSANSNKVTVTIKAIGTKDDCDKAIEKAMKALEESKKRQADLKGIPGLGVSDKNEETKPIGKANPDEVIRKELELLERVYNDASWFTVLFTDKLNRFLSVRDTNRDIISIKLDDTIYTNRKIIDYLESSIKVMVNKLDKNLDDLMETESFLKDKDNINQVKINNFKFRLNQVNETKEELSELRQYIKNAGLTTDICLRESADYINDTKVRYFDIHEKKSNSVVLRLNFSDIQASIRSLDSIKNYVDNLRVKLSKVEKRFQNFNVNKLIENNTSIDPEIVKEYNSIFTNVKESIMQTSMCLSFIVAIANSGDSYVRALALMIKTINNEKTKKEIQAFENLIAAIKSKRAQLNK